MIINVDLHGNQLALPIRDRWLVFLIDKLIPCLFNSDNNNSNILDILILIKTFNGQI